MMSFLFETCRLGVCIFPNHCMKISVFVLKINEKPVTAIFFSDKTIPLPKARASPNTSSIPLLFLSAEMDLTNWNRFRAFGGMLNGKKSYDAGQYIT